MLTNIRQRCMLLRWSVSASPMPVLLLVLLIHMHRLFQTRNGSVDRSRKRRTALGLLIQHVWRDRELFSGHCHGNTQSGLRQPTSMP
jgi:hypothetical protein